MPLQKINTIFLHKNIVSLDQFDQPSIQTVFQTARQLEKRIEKKQSLDLLKGVIVTLLFFEPSSRTFSSFATAVKKLGGQTLEYQNPTQTSSAVKGETLEDTIRVFENFSDLIVLRHPETGSAQKAAQAAFFKPVINAGDGSGEHPTQALLDLYTVNQHCGALSGLTGLIVGDMIYGRTVHSLLRGLSFYKNNTVYLLSPKQLKLEKELFHHIQKRGVKLIEIESEEKIPKNCNFWYWTRVQKERFKNLKQYERVKNTFILTPKILQQKGNKNMIIMHPLPRVGEIDPAVDADPRALYFTTQIRNGLFVRMALMSLILGRYIS